MTASKNCRNCGHAKSEHPGKAHAGRCPGEKGRGAPRYQSPDTPIYVPVEKRGLPGDGPWRILTECPSDMLHNTEYAALGRGRAPRCCCPRARYLHKVKLERWAEKKRERRASAENSEERAKRNAERLAAIKPSKMILQPYIYDFVKHPNFRGGLCTKPENLATVDKGHNIYANQRGIDDREAAKEMCRRCPLRESLCLPWITAAEDPKGSLGGVWAALDPWDRMGYKMIMVNGEVRLEEVKA